ncbi:MULTISPECIES: phytoene desaturase family protein [Mycobacterium]|uniref:phytoene desaturase family protein n=1 Tax=Mycobacterium TaxID=1763 RepID=UPI0005C780D4|nr:MULTISPECIES: FAD-dependent oxidoreductase [Mycobacterium]QWY63570.1 FAD-dependent oxidoreductase [Mycobacterium avium subsp. hominissuis]WSE51377.1 FAD-dependent oxidoreductase [Mycobacterium sp. 2-64]
MTNHAESLATYDAIVIGAGAGGMAAAARLNASGFTTLLVERYDRVGGRASTIDVDGFRVNTGALIIELGGENAKLFEDLGLTINARTPKRPLVLRLGRWDVPMMSGLTGLMFRALLALVGAVARRAPRMRPPRGISTAQWLSRLRAGAFLHGLVRNLTSAMFAAEPSDVEAAVFFDYLTKPKALDTYAMHPEGSIGPWRQLADHFEHNGGTLWLNSQVVALTFDDSGRVDGATIRRPDGTVRISARVVVSNAGPVATVRMCGDVNLPGGYADHVRAQSNPSTLITVNFASEQPLGSVTGLVFFGPTRRLAYAANLTATCPEMAPAGWNLYAAASTPHPATGDFDVDHEVELLKADLHEHFPGFDSARILSVEICAGEDWPAQRAIAGRDLPQTTPIANLFNVGDGVREWATAGQSGCVQSARLVTERIRAAMSPSAQSVTRA